MATNIKRQGPVQTLRYTNTGSAISSGDVVDLGSFCGIALEDIAASTGVGTVNVGGVEAELTSDTGTAWSVGDPVYWTGSAATKTAGSNTPLGIVTQAKASGGTTGRIALIGINAAPTALANW